MLLARRRSDEHAERAALALAQARLDQAQHRLTRLERDLARACRDVGVTGAALAASVEGAVAIARSTVLLYRNEIAEVRDRARAAMRELRAAEALKARRMAEFAARETRKEERELDEANHA